MQAGVVPACTGAVPFRAGLSITQPLYDTMKVLIIKFMARSASSIAAFARAAWQGVKELVQRLLQALDAKPKPSEDGCRRIAELGVLTKDIQVSCESEDSGFWFRKRRLKASQLFRVTYGTDHADKAGLPAVQLPDASGIMVKVTSCEPLGDPVITTENTPFWHRHSSLEVAGLLGSLQEKARTVAAADEATIAAAQLRLHDVFGRAV